MPERRAAHLQHLMQAGPQRLAAWAASGAEHVDAAVFQREILPELQGGPLRTLMQAAGLLRAYCSAIRRGLRVPHPRHWTALRRVMVDGRSTSCDTKAAFDRQR